MSNKKAKNLHRYNVERQAGRQAGTNVNRTDKQDYFIIQSDCSCQPYFMFTICLANEICGYGPLI